MNPLLAVGAAALGLLTLVVGLWLGPKRWPLPLKLAAVAAIALTLGTIAQKLYHS